MGICQDRHEDAQVYHDHIEHIKNNFSYDYRTMEEEKEGKIFVGPDITMDIYEGSVGELLLSKLKQQSPDNVLQVDAITGESINSSQFIEMSLKVAEGLRELGVNKGEVVAMVSRNTMNLFPAQLGTFVMGGVVAPVDPDLKVAELRFLFSIMQPKFVFCENCAGESVRAALDELENVSVITVLDATEETETEFLKFENFLKETDVDSFECTPIENPDEELALICCSSGTTGFPKGVAITHKNLVMQFSLVKSLIPPFYLHVTQPFWISGMLSLGVSCLTGIRRIFIRQFDELLIFSAIENHKAMVMLMSPAELGSLLKHPQIGEFDLRSMKLVVVGGAHLPQHTVDKFKDMMPGTIISQGYGMTELSGSVTTSSPPGKESTVGKLIPGIQSKIIDTSDGRLLGTNEQGEICFKSACVMKGYYNNDEATQETIDEDGFLHTGDLGYFDEEEYLYIVDKVKEFIKFRTWQIPPAELESFIGSLPDVLDVGVAGVPHEDDISHPMAIVVKQPDSEITEQDIIDYVAENLSDYKQLRAGVRFVEKVPRTPTGKIKRKELKKLVVSLYEIEE